MATIVGSWSSTISHIADDDGTKAGEVLTTRCGRTLKNFHFFSGETECLRCGSEDDFAQIYEERRQARLEEQKRREAAHQKQEARIVRRLEIHRQLMEDFEIMLKEIGAEIVEHREQVAGGSITFVIEDLKFKLFGNIW